MSPTALLPFLLAPFAMGQELYEAANEPKTFLEIDQAHLSGLAIYPEQIANEILRLLDE